MAFKLDHLAIDNSEVREIVKELNRYGKTDVLKALRAFNREIAKEVSDKARSLGAKQPVPKASQSTKNIKPQAVRGRSKPRKILREEVGRLPFSRRGATFPYRRWIGNQYATGTSSFGRFGKGGYVVMRTIAREQDRIMSTYNDRLYEALAKAIGKKI